jgi:hypothetical protein
MKLSSQPDITPHVHEGGQPSQELHAQLNMELLVDQYYGGPIQSQYGRIGCIIATLQYMR